MIVPFTASPEQLPKRADVSLVRFRCHYAAYRQYPALASFWVQQNPDASPGAFLCRIGSTVTLVDLGGEKEELLSLLQMLSPRVVFCSRSAVQRLGLSVETPCFVLKAPVFPGDSLEFSGSALSLSRFLGRWLEVEDESAAAADISHRLRHGCASAILRPDGAGLVYFDREFRYLTALAIPADKRHQGIGRELCRLLSRGTQSTILVCCSRENIGFYEKCGFSLCSEAAYCAVP